MLKVNGQRLPYSKWYSATDYQVQQAIDARIADGTINTPVKVFNVMDYGAVGDGVTDDAPAIRRCIDATPESGFVIVFPSGKTFLQGDGSNPRYTVGSLGEYTGDPSIGGKCSFEFIGKKNFKISAYGSKIVAHQNNSPIIANRGFYFSGCQDFVVEGVYYDGKISTRKPDGGDIGSHNSQHGLGIESGCCRFNVRDCIFTGCCMDGIFLGWGVSHGYFENCNCEYNYRQGCSIVHADYITFQRCRFAYTGRAEDSDGNLIGTSPESGIDIESSMADWDEDRCIRFDNCVFEENHGAPFTVTAGSQCAVFTGCYFSSPRNGDCNITNFSMGNKFLFNFFDHCGVSLIGTGLFMYNTFRNYNRINLFQYYDGYLYKNGATHPVVFCYNEFRMDMPDEIVTNETGFVTHNTGGILSSRNDVIFDHNTIVNAFGNNVLSTTNGVSIMSFRWNHVITGAELPTTGLKKYGAVVVNADCIEHNYIQTGYNATFNGVAQ